MVLRRAGSASEGRIEAKIISYPSVLLHRRGPPDELYVDDVTVGQEEAHSPIEPHQTMKYTGRGTAMVRERPRIGHMPLAGGSLMARGGRSWR